LILLLIINHIELFVSIKEMLPRYGALLLFGLISAMLLLTLPFYIYGTLVIYLRMDQGKLGPPTSFAWKLCSRQFDWTSKDNSFYQYQKKVAILKTWRIKERKAYIISCFLLSDAWISQSIKEPLYLYQIVNSHIIASILDVKMRLHFNNCRGMFVTC
jgi:hypothetical protein